MTATDATTTAAVSSYLHEFFVASASVAGALIGLLFVAISVAGERLRAEDAGPINRIRASAALTSFTNAVAVSLFALIPGDLGGGAVAFSLLGLLFVGGALLSLRTLRTFRFSYARDLLFMIGLGTVMVIQLVTALHQVSHETASGRSTIAQLIVFCFLIGIARSWELIGGPTIDLRREAFLLGREVVTREHADPPGRDA